jgi:hypothetical protein
VGGGVAGDGLLELGEAEHGGGHDADTYGEGGSVE